MIGVGTVTTRIEVAQNELRGRFGTWEGHTARPRYIELRFHESSLPANMSTAAAIALIRSWREQGDADEQRAVWQAVQETLDEAKLSL